MSGLNARTIMLVFSVMTEITKKIVIAAANGFLGRHATAALLNQGYRIVALVREGRQREVISHPQVEIRVWDGKKPGDWAGDLDHAAGVMNLVGRSVDCVKTPEHRKEIMDSRIEATRVLGEACRAVANPPPVWLQAGTAHIIGDPEPRDTVCDDATIPPTHGLAPQVGRAWEGAFARALLPSQRGVMFRISFVIGPDGGALQRLVPLTKAFLGGTVGRGDQWMSWLHIEDLNRLWLAALENPRYHGTYMATAPHPVTNRVFMRTLRHACSRPWSPPAPGWAVRLAAPFLKTDPELALLGRRVVPTRLREEAGFEFKWPDLEPALRDTVERWGDAPRVCSN